MPPKQLSGTAVPFTLLTTADVPVKQEGAIGLCVLISLFPPVEPSAGATRQVSPTQGGIADSSRHHQPKKTSANRKSQRSWFYYLHQKMADNTTHTSVSLCPVKVKTRFFKIYKCDFQPILSCNPISHPTHHTTQAILVMSQPCTQFHLPQTPMLFPSHIPTEIMCSLFHSINIVYVL